MNLSPIAKALSILRDSKVDALVIGGQACVLYGGAEFSRDLDLAVLVSRENINRLRQALETLQGEQIYFPELTEAHLRAGHGCHFRCLCEGLLGIRIDILGVLRGVGSFENLWPNRRSISIEAGIPVEVIGLQDLVRSKKTQRDKDWPMIRRLVEADIANSGESPTRDQIRFWIEECRTPEILVSLVAQHSDLAEEIAHHRPAILAATRRDRPEIESQLRIEEETERAIDREYWAPLKSQLGEWRRNRGR